MRRRVNRANKGIIGGYSTTDGTGVFTNNYKYLDNTSGYPEINYYNDQGNTYQPPSEWRSLPTINVGDQKFAGVFAVYNTDGNFVAIRAQNAYIVDWGDGTTGAFASNVVAYKQYTQSTYSGLTSNEFRGYKTLVVQVTPQAGNNLTQLDLDVKHNQANLSNYSSNWLNILMSAPNLTFLDIGSDNTSDIQPRMLEQFIFIGTNNVTTQDSRGMFSGSTSLIKVFIDTSNFTDTYRMFYQCHNLRSVPAFNTSKCTSVQDMFNTCRNLKTLPWMDTSNVTNFQGMLSGCSSLVSVPPFNTSKATNLSSMFGDCTSLVDVPNIDASKATTIGSLFQNCYSLTTAPKIFAPSATTVTNLFLGCSRLVKVVDLTISSSITSIANMFNSCRCLEEVPFFNTANVTSFSGTFQNCSRLKKIPPYNTSSVTNFLAAFQNCSSLIDFPELNYSSGLDFQNMFSGCIRMKGGTNFGLTLSSGITFASTFNGCASIQYLPPMNLSQGRNLITMFTNCLSLNTVTINGICGGTGFNTTSFNSMFSGCNSLQSVTGSMNFSGYTGSAFVNVYASMFNVCYALETLTGFTGIQHNFNLTNCKMGATALNAVYYSLAGVTGKTITVTGNWGTVNDDPTIATAKGWTVTG